MDNVYFREFYASLNVDNDLWRTKGRIQYEDGDTKREVIMRPQTLIGLDIIRASSVGGSKDVIQLKNFNHQNYRDFWKAKFVPGYNKVIPWVIYQSVESKESDK